MEFYKRSFSQLVEDIGREEALKRVDNYLQLSEKYKDVKTFCVHSCLLLKTYAESNQFGEG